MSKKELIVEELDNISGGRAWRGTEQAEWMDAASYVDLRVRSLEMVGKHDAAAAYKKGYEAAFAKYKEDIKNAPADGPDIKFSDYFKI